MQCPLQSTDGKGQAVKCKASVKIEQAFNGFQKGGSEYLESLGEELLKHYKQHEAGMKTCPSCSYSGFVDNRERGCTEKLKCEVCDNQNWLDSDLFETYRNNSWCHRARGAVQRTIMELVKLIFTEPCPQCGAYISKDGGCNSVVCGRCRH